MSLVFTWPDVRDAVAEIARRLPERPDCILAVARGGLVPATMLSHLLGTRHLYAVQVESYEGKTAEKPRFVDSADHRRLVNLALAARRGGTRVLIVDDVLETGGTMAFLEGYFPTATAAVLAQKHPQSLLFGGRIHWGRRVDPAQWIEFPWEAGV